MQKSILKKINKLFYIFIFIITIFYSFFYFSFIFPSIKKYQNEKDFNHIRELTSMTNDEFKYFEIFIKDNAEYNLLYDIVKNYSTDKDGKKTLNELFTLNTLELYGIDYIGVYDELQNEIMNRSNSEIQIKDIFSKKNKKYFFSTQTNGENRVKITSGYINIDNKIYTFISHLITSNNELNDFAGHLLYFKKTDQQDFLKFQSKDKVSLEFYVPTGKDKELIKNIKKQKQKLSYYSNFYKKGKKTYYIPYMENFNKIAFIIKLNVDNKALTLISLGILTGILPIFILSLFILYLKKIVEEEFLIPIVSFYNHIYSIRKNDKYVLMEQHKGNNEIDEVIKVFNSLMIEVRDQKKNIESKKIELEKLAYIDYLTGLSTRRLLDEKYKLLFESAKRSEEIITLIMIDVDYFKKYNDRYGHQKGDIALKIIGKLLKSTFKRDGDIVSRYGGEEFVVVLYKTTLDNTLILVKKFQEKLEIYDIEHEDSSFKRLTVSMGIKSTTVNKNKSSYTLLEGADRNLYKAKNSGRNKYIF